MLLYIGRLCVYMLFNTMCLFLYIMSARLLDIYFPLSYKTTFCINEMKEEKKIYKNCKGDFRWEESFNSADVLLLIFNVQIFFFFYYSAVYYNNSFQE